MSDVYKFDELGVQRLLSFRSITDSLETHIAKTFRDSYHEEDPQSVNICRALFDKAVKLIITIPSFGPESRDKLLELGALELSKIILVYEEDIKLYDEKIQGANIFEEFNSFIRALRSIKRHKTKVRHDGNSREFKSR
jgi:hypothetical protein